MADGHEEIKRNPLADALRQRGFTLAVMGAASGMGVPNVSAAFNAGKLTPRLAEATANALGLTLDEVRERNASYCRWISSRLSGKGSAKKATKAGKGRA